MNIPDEVVEAAAKAGYEAVDITGIPWEQCKAEGNIFRYGKEVRRARAALEAAAPMLMAEVWDEGWQKAHATDDPAMAGIFFNPYRSIND